MVYEIKNNGSWLIYGDAAVKVMISICVGKKCTQFDAIFTCLCSHAVNIEITNIMTDH